LKHLNIRVLLAGSAAALLIALAAVGGYAAAHAAGLQRLRETEQNRLDVFGAALSADLSRLAVLPSLLEAIPNVFALLDAPSDDRLREEVNRSLQSINGIAGAEMLYVLDLKGTARAAADASAPGSPLGADLSFRPYVQDALNGRPGRFYGVGVTSGRPGYYLSYALSREGRQRGVAAVKVNLEDAEAAWRGWPGDVLLVDEHGVVIMASRAKWKFRPLTPLTPSGQDEAARSRRYGKAPLEPLAWRDREPLDVRTRVVDLDGVQRLASSRMLVENGWQLIVLDDIAPVAAAARNAAITAGLAGAAVVLLGVVGLQRRRAIRLERSHRALLQAAHDSLEAKVIERTAELREAQNDLVHAGRMAALGQMSAGMVHELNQPLAAMRTLSDNACVMLSRAAAEPGHLEGVQGNLERIARLVDRLGRLTRQLKSFAHRSDAPLVTVDIAQCVAGAQFIVSQRMREHDVEFRLEVEPAGLSVRADASRLEQVLVNLIGNAIDAMAGSPERVLRVTAAMDEGRRVVSIAVTDTGPGIRPDMLPRLFEPFATSKPAGSGLGLGLMISADIVRDLGGSLRAANLAGGGARFLIELPGDGPGDHGKQ
jgi:two-component system C4-dicarboxylate transport sensor histidine kinase DctB